MFGWEFPPFNSGGLGVACEGLLRGLTGQGADVAFVLPRTVPVEGGAGRMLFADDGAVENGSVSALTARLLLSPYVSAALYSSLRTKLGAADFAGDLFEEVARYALRAASIARQESFDVIHAHDWLSFPAAIEAKRVSGRPFVAHVHATEYDRTGNMAPDGRIVEIERAGLETADRIIAVSDFTRRKIVEAYGIAADKIDVVHNAIDEPAPAVGRAILDERRAAGKKIVLFVGRLTLQKGPDYFVRAAKIVSRLCPEAMFVVVGAGDMQRRMIDDAAAMGIADKMLFTGFLRDRELARVYRGAHVFVMPSVSEPFGITCLESLVHGVPAVISRQSGVAETVGTCLKADFWDVEDMAAKIVAILRYGALAADMSANGRKESTRFTWEAAAKKCLETYRKAAEKAKEVLMKEV